MNLSRMIAGLLALAGSAFLVSAQAKPVSPNVGANVGVEQVAVPVPGDAAVPVMVLYPSTSAARPQVLGPFRLDVAMAGEPVARWLPLIVMSHGTGGSALGSVNLAMALAKAGFVVAAVEHPGDNYHDRSRSFTRANFVARAHQISAAIDFLLNTWRHREIIDSARIGMFGHSAGGTTTLIIGGGVLDWGQVARFCLGNPEDWGCKSSRGLNPVANRADADAAPIAAADPRVRALAVAAPALTHGFAPAGLAKLKLPVQLWVAGQDAIVPDAGRLTGLMPAKPDRHDVANAGHFSFLVPCSDGLQAAAPEICIDRQGFDRAAFQREFTSAIVRFFQAHLRG
ncbi:MAG: prolyl oligopeptidase family serine peptidase [Sphingomonadales bacterium]|nr:prolyl oligopeptidase family serine peptidase [Sphingomonadales bacterium]